LHNIIIVTGRLGLIGRELIACSFEGKEEAIVFYEKAIEIEPEPGHAWNEKGNALYDWKKYYKEAIKCFNKARDIDKTLSGAQIKLELDLSYGAPLADIATGFVPSYLDAAGRH
jgi:tetratricopeptide (TPR) repeat protein